MKIMINKEAETFIFLLVFLEIKFLDAQVANKSGNQGDGITSVDSRFYDRGDRGMGYPNLQKPGRIANPSSNYPGNSFPPNGNQNGNMQRPQPDFGWRPYTQHPNPGRPYQGPDRYPANYPENYPDNRPNSYPGNRGDIRYPPSSNNFRPDDYNGEYRPGFNSMNQNPNNQRPPYDNMPGDRIEYPGYTDRPYQNGGRPFHQDDYPNRPGIPGDSRQPIEYPSHNGNFQGSPNQRPGGSNPDFRPDYPDDILESLKKFPENNVRPKQYPPNNNQHSNYPNDSNGNQFPYQSNMNQGQANYRPGSNEVFQGNLNGVPPTRPQLPNNRPIDSINGPNANDSVDIPGKPVFVPSSNSPNGQVIFDGSTESPSQKQCEQSCPTTSEYDPVCGTNNVTYGNLGRFNCARKCGVAVNLLRTERCPNDTPVN